MKTIRCIIACSLVFFCIFPGHLQGQNLPGNEVSEINQHHLRNKLFLHFDKEHYVSGETIWFKAYLLNAEDFLPDSVLTNLNIELFDFQGKPVLSRKYKISDGSSYGDIFIDSLIADGNYLLHAYTDVVADSFKNNVFQKYFYIENPIHSNRISNQEIRQNTQFNKLLDEKKSEIMVRLFPEGGDLVYGMDNQIFVFASNVLGVGVRGKGMIMDNSGYPAAEFITSEKGFSEFTFTPLQDKTYVASFKSEEEISGDIELPQIIKTGAIMNINSDPASDRIIIRIFSNEPGTERLILTGTKGRDSVFYKEFTTTPGLESFIEIDKSELPAGIVHFEVYDEKGQRLLYRPVLADYHRQSHVDLNAQALQYEKDRVMNLNLNLYDASGASIQGEMSVSVLAGDMDHVSSARDIVSHLLVHSEHSNIRELHDKDFAESVNEEGKLIDMFVLTGDYHMEIKEQTTEPDNIPDILKRDFGIKIRGSVSDPFTSQPVSAVRLELRYGVGIRKAYQSVSDEQGIFEFSGLELPDSVNVEITAELISGGVRPNISLFQKVTAPISYQMNSSTQAQMITKRGNAWKRIRRPVVRTKVPASPYGNPDQTIIMTDRMIYYNLLELLQERAVGLMISGNTIMFRGPSSINYSNEPLFIKDHVIVSMGEFLQQNPREIERIELFKGASAAFFGARGANGVIVSYSKRGQVAQKPYSEFMVKGFSTPSEFVLNRNLGENDFNNDRIHTVLWAPSIRTNENGSVTLRFLLIPGVKQYMVIIQGISADGGIISGEFLISN